MGCEMPPERAPLWGADTALLQDPGARQVPRQWGARGRGRCQETPPQRIFQAPALPVPFKVGNCIMLEKEGRPSSRFVASLGSRLPVYRCRCFPPRRVPG